VTRVVFMVFFAVLVLGRAVEIHHHHDTVSHTESCIVCRAVQTPAAPLHRGLGFHLLIAPAVAAVPAEPTLIPPESLVLGSHPLRAPPWA